MNNTIVDLFNVLHISFSISQTQAIKEKGKFTEEDVGLYYHKVLDFVIYFAKTYGNVIYANEGKGSLEWRRSIYPEYKMNRKHDDVYQIFKNHLPDVLELINLFPSKIITVDGAEADDVMYGLATHFADKNEEVTVITSDRDMAQLCNYSDNIKVFSPATKTFRTKQPNLILEKAIVGDPSDNISGIPRIGIKTFEKALNDKILWETKIAPHQEIIDKFIKIVDLSKAPAHLKEESVIQYNKHDFSTFDPQAIESFMFEYGLREHLNKWGVDLGDINMALYENSLTINEDKKIIETVKLNDVEDMLQLINNL